MNRMSTNQKEYVVFDVETNGLKSKKMIYSQFRFINLMMEKNIVSFCLWN